MNRYLQARTSQIIEELPVNDAPRPSPLRRPLARCRTWRLKHRRQAEARWLELRRHAKDQLLASRVQDIIIGCGLTQFSYGLGGSRTLRAPRVLSVFAGPPMGVDILILPGQMPDHFAVHAPAIAYNLGVTEIRVVPLGPSQIRLELLQEPA